MHATKHKFYDFTAQLTTGPEVRLADYAGKVLLIVNTASECGYTKQYRELEELYQQYKDKGLEVLAFPSNDFGGQEPLEGEAIAEFCNINFRTTFPVFNKVKVVGLAAHPLFRYLSNKSENGNVNVAPKWNFHKYLVGRDGNVIDYYFSFTSPLSSKVKQAIERAL